MLIRDRQADPGQPRLLERPQELDPEAARLDLADVQADHLAQPGLVHGIGDDECLAEDAAVIADLDGLGVQPQIRIRPSSGRWRNSSTSSSNARHIAETRSLVIPSIPSCSTTADRPSGSRRR